MLAKIKDKKLIFFVINFVHTKPVHAEPDSVQTQAQTTSRGTPTTMTPSTSTAKQLSSVAGKTQQPPTK